MKVGSDSADEGVRMTLTSSPARMRELLPRVLDGVDDMIRCTNVRLKLTDAERYDRLLTEKSKHTLTKGTPSQSETMS